MNPSLLLLSLALLTIIKALITKKSNSITHILSQMFQSFEPYQSDEQAFQSAHAWALKMVVMIASRLMFHMAHPP